MFKFAQDVALSYVRETGKPRCKLSHKILKLEYEYYPLLDISPYPTLIQLKDFLDGIHHCVIFFGKWIFDSNFTFAPPFTKDNLGYC